jgi:hypothetical protein
MTGYWETAWDAINTEFSRLAEQLLTANPDIWWSCGHAENDAFPFWTYASFGRSGVPGDEDVVVSLSFKDDEGRLRFTSDVAFSDGRLIAEGPNSVEPASSDRAAWVGESVSAGLAFVGSQLDALRSLL